MKKVRQLILSMVVLLPAFGCEKEEEKPEPAPIQNCRIYKITDEDTGKHLEFQYNNAGQIIRVDSTAYTYNWPDGYIFFFHYEYNEFGKVSKEVAVWTKGGKSDTVAQALHLYNADSLISETRHYRQNPATKALELDFTTRYTFNAQKKIAGTSAFKAGSPTIAFTKSDYFHFENNALQIETYMPEPATNTQKLVEVKNIKSDTYKAPQSISGPLDILGINIHNRLSETTTNYQTMAYSSNVYAYTYNTSGYPLTRTLSLPSGQTKKLTYTYSCQ